MPVKDLTGQKFGKLTVIERDFSNTGGAAYWLCKCDCGNPELISVRGQRLRTGEKWHCGCVKPQSKIDTTSMVGKTFGKLTVIERDLSVEIGHGHEAKWICECSCPDHNRVSVRTADLLRGQTRSCGCLKTEVLLKRNTLDLTGQRFGMVVAVENTGKLSDHHSYIWRCECDCGNKEYYCSAEHLRSGRVHSCGCARGSYGEKKIEEILTENNISFNKQQTFKDLKSDRNYQLKYDFSILDDNDNVIRLIEFDGEQHYRKKALYYDDRNLILDQIKNDYAKEHNIPLVRIPYKELKNLSIELLLGDKYLIW